MLPEIFILTGWVKMLSQCSFTSHSLSWMNLTIFLRLVTFSYEKKGVWIPLSFIIGGVCFFLFLILFVAFEWFRRSGEMPRFTVKFKFLWLKIIRLPHEMIPAKRPSRLLYISYFSNEKNFLYLWCDRLCLPESDREHKRLSEGKSLNQLSPRQSN